ncbi:hypothetical protein [Caballeronia sp. LZ032]|uniref:hypothetical protein n=1 Tax=Caballeronia sp. LZ032 TaxID=3038565 RepID=UPI00285D2EEB|nr:hypothetical protein [Caballeronia sp. LZ032]MDR5881620.1 hypothetical protein [Caballeronia sp. LZ032]
MSKLGQNALITYEVGKDGKETNIQSRPLTANEFRDYLKWRSEADTPENGADTQSEAAPSPQAATQQQTAQAPEPPAQQPMDDASQNAGQQPAMTPQTALQQQPATAMQTAAQRQTTPDQQTALPPFKRPRRVISIRKAAAN